MVFQVDSWQPPGKGHEPLRYGRLVADGATLNPEQAKRVLVFWPGLGGSVKNALGFFNRLLPGVDAVVVPDLAGFGLNDTVALPSVTTHVAQAVAFMSWAEEQFPKATFVAGGISLGAVLQAQACLQRQAVLGKAKSRWIAQCWVAPAFKAHPKTFTLAYQWQALLQLAKGQPVGLPYGIEALTRNPDVLADTRQQEHCQQFRVPMSYLLGIRALAQKTGLQVQSLAYTGPTWVAIPEGDLVCCPTTMATVAFGLPKPKTQAQLGHTVRVWPAMFHDMFLEPEMPQLAEDTLRWLLAVYNNIETVF